MKQPILITCQPDDQVFIFQNHLYIESCLENGFTEDQIHILLYKPTYRKINENWNKLKQCYPKLNLFWYEDKGVQHQLGIYIPVLRPHLLWQHFTAFPFLEKETVLYTDADILWTRKPDIEKFYDNDTCYVSDASSYLNADYFARKQKEVIKPTDRDFLKEICELVGITKEKAVENNNNTGGVQYLLKNITAEFWKKIEKDVISLRLHMMNDINKNFYKDENSGLQSWCSDLWAIQYNLWLYGKESKTVPEMNFTWATDPIEKLQTNSIFHNAGVASTYMFQNTENPKGVPMFYKGKYISGEDPTLDPHVKEVMSHPLSQKLCTSYYAKKLLELKEKYKLDY